MTIVDDINSKFRKYYIVTARCTNCKSVQDIKVPKGETVKDYFGSERGKCENCGTACLEVYKKPSEEKESERKKDFKTW